MSLGTAVLVGLALSAAPKPAASPPATVPEQAQETHSTTRTRVVPAGQRAPQPPPVVCTKYRVLAEKSDLAPEAEVASWVTSGLEKAALLDPASLCFVHVRITAGALRTGGKEDGFVAHVAASTRRFFKDGKLVTREKGLLLVEPHRENLVPRVRTFLEEYVASLAATPSGERAGSDGG
jgi:hypothetical protein